MTKEELLRKFTQSNGRFNSAAIRHMNSNELELILSLTSNFPDNTPIKDRLLAIKTNQQSPNLCPVCSTPLPINKRSCNSTCYSKTQEFRDGMKKRDYQQANDKRQKTLEEKYGYSYNSQRPEVKTILRKSKLIGTKDDSLSYLENKEWLEEHHLRQKMSAVRIAEILGVDFSTVIAHIKKQGIDYKIWTHASREEETIARLLNTLGVDYTRNDNSLIGPKHVDFYIPERQIAIEINGIKWHSESFGKKDRNYHRDKYLACRGGAFNYYSSGTQKSTRNQILCLV